MSDEKRGPGRPTKYTEEMCERALELAAEGYGRVETSVGLGIALSTFQEWEKVHPEFAEAMKLAAEISEAWWAGQGRKGIWSRDFNANAYAFQMKNRFNGWKDKQETAHVGGINLTITSDDAKL